jgi:hypothetical protein
MITEPSVRTWKWFKPHKCSYLVILWCSTNLWGYIISNEIKKDHHKWRSGRDMVCFKVLYCLGISLKWLRKIIHVIDIVGTTTQWQDVTHRTKVPAPPLFHVCHRKVSGSSLCYGILNFHKGSSHWLQKGHKSLYAFPASPSQAKWYSLSSLLDLANLWPVQLQTSPL